LGASGDRVSYCSFQEAAVLPKRRNDIWNEGFQAGQVLNSECPYPVGSPGAKEWLEGWAVGIHERGKPDGMAEPPPPEGWKGFFRKLIDW
jgi:hypothetical protein